MDYENGFGAERSHISRARCGAPTLVLVVLAAFMITGRMTWAQSEDEQKLLSLTNDARQDAGLKPLEWDEGLAVAARAHAQRMAQEGEISHRYGGEEDLPQRAAKAGAHFSLIEENIAIGDSPFKIHEGWMKSQAHHDNLLNAQVSRVGFGLARAHGVLYAVGDYSVGVASMTAEQVESAVGKVVAARGVSLLNENAAARRYCGQDSRSDEGKDGGVRPRFLMRWQSAEITNLPPQLQQALASGKYSQASVGACASQGDGSGGPVFSGFRVAVLLY